jgi:hypothetical protein
MKGTKDGVAYSKLATKQSPTSKAPKSGANDDSLKKVQAMVNKWLAYRKKLLPGWERDIKLYNNERVECHYQGVADTFVPMTFSTIETIVSALATGNLNTEFLPQDIYKYLKDRLAPGFDPNNEAGETEQDFLVRAIKEALSGGVIEDESLEVLNALYDYFWECGKWNRKLIHFIKSGVKIGNGAMWLTWEKGRPTLVNVPFPNYVFDPDAMDDDTGSFQGRRYLSSKQALKDETIIDPATGKLKKRYNLTGLNKKTGDVQDKTDKELKEQIMFGSTTYVAPEKESEDDDNDQVEVIEIRTADRTYTLVNRKCLAEDEVNPIVAQAKLRNIPVDDLITMPGITWANYEDESLLIGRSETSTFWKEQERLNDSTNQKSDAVTRALLQQYQADPALKSQKESFSVPGAVIWAQQNQFNAIPPAQVPNAAFNEENSIKGNIRETTATDQLVKGVGSTSDITATEANIQVAGSSQRNELKTDVLSLGAFNRLALLTLQYIRLFIVDPYIVPQSANGGIKPLFYDPSKYDHNFEPKVTLTLQAQSKRRQEQNENLETYKILIQDPTNDLKAVKEIMLPKIVDLDNDEIKRIVDSTVMPPALPPQPGDPSAAPAAPMPAMPMGMPQ